MRAPIRCAVLAVLALSLGHRAWAAEPRTAVPKPQEQAVAEKVVHDVFKDDYLKNKPSDRTALAGKLLAEAEKTQADPPSQYVLLREARDVAVKAGDTPLAFSAIDAMAERFEVSAAAEKAKAAEALATSANTPGAAAELVESMLTAADAAVASDDLDAAASLMHIAELASRKAASPALVITVVGRSNWIKMVQKEMPQVNLAREILKAKPQDADANTVVGRYLCLVKRDWDSGLPLLMQGADAKLKAAAQQDINAAGGDASAQLAAADAWFDLSSTLELGKKISAQLRALSLYEKAEPGLSGLLQVKAQKRAEELVKLADERPDRNPMWVAIRRATLEKKFKVWPHVGGAFARQDFTETLPDGGILIGFNYTEKDKGKYPGVIQAIYLTPRGEVLGPVHGKPDAGARQLTCRARPGYAVGAIYARGGGGLDAFKPIFMRIDGTKLNVDDKYDGPYVGGQGGGAGTSGGDGSLVIGMCGKVADDGKIEAISTVTIDAQATAGKP